MPKQYKAICTKHENEILSSFVGEDLDDFRKRMLKQGHEVGELKNAEYMLTEKGNLLIVEILTIIEKLSSKVKDLENEYKEVKLDGARPDFRKDANPGKDKPDIPESSEQ